MYAPFQKWGFVHRFLAIFLKKEIINMPIRRLDAATNLSQEGWGVTLVRQDLHAELIVEGVIEITSIFVK